MINQHSTRVTDIALEVGGYLCHYSAIMINTKSVSLLITKGTLPLLRQLPLLLITMRPTTWAGKRQIPFQLPLDHQVDLYKRFLPLRLAIFLLHRR